MTVPQASPRLPFMRENSGDARKSPSAPPQTVEVDGPAPTIVILHAGGFSGECYQELAEALPFRAVAFDLPGHGRNESPLPDTDVLNWQIFADAAAKAIAATPGPKVIFGHSLGGASAILAAADAEEEILGIALYEPVTVDPSNPRAIVEANELAARTLLRKTHFASEKAAVANFAAKPPISCFTKRSREAYVKSCFRRDQQGVTLTLSAHAEASMYRGGPFNETLWRLSELALPILFMGGETSDSFGRGHAERLAAGYPHSRLATFPGLGHFGPMEEPSLVAGAVAAFAGDLVRSN